MFGFAVIMIIGILFNVITLVNAAMTPNPTTILLFWIGGNQIGIAIMAFALVSKRIEINELRIAAAEATQSKAAG